MDKRGEYISGVKILILYKQHYLNQYIDVLDCQYSCWGYFDGMDVIGVKKSNSQLFEKKSNAALSDTWYQTAYQTKNQKGIASEQSIGLFRCEEGEDNKEEKFWEKGTRKAFLMACFVQLSEEKKKEEARSEIEQCATEEVDIISYFMFDNADMVLFFQGNSFTKMLEQLKKIDEKEYVVYSHPICGVLEELLTKMKNSYPNPPKDMAGNLVINDEIKEIRIDIVGNVGMFENNLKFLLNQADNTYKLQNYEKSTLSYMAGHESYVYSLKDTNMYTLLYMLIPEGVLTHKNGIFGKKLYNMETQIIIEETSINSIHAVEPAMFNQGQNDQEKGHICWCRNQIKLYREYMNKAWEDGDESLYAYYQSVIKTLNTLYQLENFDLSKDIFFIIYPAFQFFSGQLGECGGEQLYQIDMKKREVVMDTIQDFMEAVNSIIYHAVHMDQVFLMIPGCSGTSFSIPTKLSMFYLWYLDSISKILNDSSNKYKFYLTPVMESKPRTYLAEFGLPPKDRLICVRVSQRSLYMPRALLLILTHETAHYVGEKIREREKRLRYVVLTLGSIIAEAIIPYWKIERLRKERENYEKYFLEKKERIATIAAENLGEGIRYKLKGKNAFQMYHVSQIEKILWDECAIILADENGILKEIVKNIPDELHEKCTSFEERVKLVEYFSKESEECNNRRISFLAGGKMDRVISTLLREYQEIFADAAAIQIAEFDFEEYEIAFNISEGYKVKKENISQTDYNRMQVLSRVYFPGKREAKSVIQPTKNLAEYWPCLDIVSDNMENYLRVCKELLRVRVEEEKEVVVEIKEAVKIFSSQENSCRKTYNFIDEKAHEYAKMTEEDLKKNLEPLD